MTGSDLLERHIVGSMHFMINGEVSLSLFEEDDKVTDHDRSSLLVTSEFLMYALERDDWMSTFLSLMNKNLKDLEQQSLRERFKVIEGGLSTTSKDSKNT